MKIYKILAVIILSLGVSAISNAAAYMKIEGIKGESNDRAHKEWILIESMSSPVFRAHVESDASGQCALRSRGDTTLGDVVVVRELDKSSTKLQEAVCGGTFFREITIDLISTKRRGSEPYLRYRLVDCIITNYSVAPGNNGNGVLVPLEEVTISYGDITFEYVEGRRDTKGAP